MGSRGVAACEHPSNRADLSFLSLESVSYYPGPFANDLTGTLNSDNWSPAFGGGPPGWIEDGAGIIRLQGSPPTLSVHTRCR